MLIKERTRQRSDSEIRFSRGRPATAGAGLGGQDEGRTDFGARHGSAKTIFEMERRTGLRLIESLYVTGLTSRDAIRANDGTADIDRPVVASLGVHAEAHDSQRDIAEAFSLEADHGR